MSEEEYLRLKDFLLPFVLERYKEPAVNAEFRRIIEDITKAFLWCLVSIPDEMHLQEIATISIAEAFYERGLYNLMNNLVMGSKTVSIESVISVFPGEIHNWLLFLQNNGQLKGTYNRFTGIYKAN